MEKQKAGKFTIRERRVLITFQVADAWKKVYEEYKETIIKTFCQVGLSLNPDGSEDLELKIKDLSDIVVGDYNQPIIVPDEDGNIGDTIEVQEERFLYTEQELAQGVAEQEEDPNDVTTDSGDDTDVRFDYDPNEDLESEYDEEIDGDVEDGDCNMD